MGQICFPTDVEWSMVRLRLCSHQVDVYTPKTITYVYIYSLFILPIHTINIPIAFYGGQCICVKYYIFMFFLRLLCYSKDTAPSWSFCPKDYIQVVRNNSIATYTSFILKSRDGPGIFNTNNPGSIPGSSPVYIAAHMCRDVNSSPATRERAMFNPGNNPGPGRAVNSK